MTPTYFAVIVTTALMEKTIKIIKGYEPSLSNISVATIDNIPRNPIKQSTTKNNNILTLLATEGKVNKG